MNSRAAYDEDEVLRKVLEESKHERPTEGSENGTRKKRGRDESEEYVGLLHQCDNRSIDANKLCCRTKPEIKRQRTGSRSPSGSPVIESEDDSTTVSAPKQKPRGAAAKSQREKELREKERERVEAANRRKGRAERRKGEGTTTPGICRTMLTCQQIRNPQKLLPSKNLPWQSPLPNQSPQKHRRPN